MQSLWVRDSGELYYSKGADLNQKHPALIVGAPYGGVKEQGPCVYGNELAQKGFIVLTFPILFVIGDRAHSRFFSEDAYQAALELKEMYVVEDAEHIDLYDRRERLPFEKLAEFFGTNM